MGRRFLIGILMGSCLLNWSAAASGAQDPARGAERAVDPAKADHLLFGQSEFPHPVWMAIIVNPNGARSLVGQGDPVFRGTDPLAVGVVKSVTPASLTIRLEKDGREARGFLGRPFPGAPELVVEDFVAVNGIEYRHRPVPPNAERLLNGELYFAGMEAGRAILQRDIDPAVLALQAQQYLNAIPVKQVEARTWEVSASDAQRALESARVIVNNAYRTGQLDLGLGSGLSVKVKSPLGDVQFDQKGFVITSPSIASRVGLEVGDRIVTINENPITGVSDLISAYRSIEKAPSVRMVRVGVERNGQPITLTYHIR